MKYTLSTLPKSLEPYRHLIENVDDWRHTGEGLRLLLHRGYTWNDCHAVIGKTVSECVADLKQVKSGCLCEDCHPVDTPQLHTRSTSELPGAETPEK